MGNFVNPRYACYCASAGVTSVGAMTFRDRMAWPGGVMTGYILWNKAQIREFAATLSDHDAGRCFVHGNLSGEGHSRYDSWLQAKFPEWSKIEVDLDTKAV